MRILYAKESDRWGQDGYKYSTLEKQQDIEKRTMPGAQTRAQRTNDENGSGRA